MPLTFMTPGTEGMIKRVSGRDDVRRLLESLGFVAGGKVTMISSMGNNIIIGIRGTRVAIDKSMAQRIHV